MEHLNQKKKMAIMFAIMSAMLFAALNQTIVGTALPRIVAELGGENYFSWVFTIFMLASTITAVLVGRLSDIYGRKPFILAGIVIFMLGSFLSGLSTSIFDLIAYRGIQGMGAGVIMSTSFTAVGDLFPPRERGRWQGLMSSVFGLASILGPTLGGYIVDHTHWQWVFWVFLPVGIVALALIWVLFPSVERSAGETIDYLGSVFLTMTIIPLLLAFSWAGDVYTWSSMEIIGLFAAASVSLTAFIVVEMKARIPLLPLHLFRNQMFTLSNVIGFLMGTGMFGALMYMPFFLQGVLGTSAATSGYVMIPMTLSMVVTSSVIGQIITRTGKYKMLAIIGTFVMMLGMFLLAQMTIDTKIWVAILYTMVLGMGLGMGLPIFTLTVQNAVDHSLLGVATATAQLFRQLGGTIGVSIMATIMNLQMRNNMSKFASERGISDPESLSPEIAEKMEMLQSFEALMDPEQLADLKAEMPASMLGVIDHTIQMLRESLGFALSGAFLTGGIVMCVAFVLTLFLKEIPLRTTMRQEASASHEK